MIFYRRFKRTADRDYSACRKPLSLFIALISVAALLASCGKKVALKLPVQEKPEAPHIRNVIHRENMMILNWTYPDSPDRPIEHFIVFKSSESGFDIVSKPAAADRSYTDYDFKEDTTASYEMVAVTLDGRHSDSSLRISVHPQSVPPSPEALSLTVLNSSVKISWNPTGDHVFYNIYKRAAEEAFGLRPLNASPLSETSFSDTLNPLIPAYYAVRSLTGSPIRDEGSLSPEVGIHPSDLVPSQPRNVRYFASAEGIYLIWDESAEPWVTVYRIYRRMQDSQFTLLGETMIPTFIDREKPAVCRDYRVSAAGPVTEGNFAELKSVCISTER